MLTIFFTVLAMIFLFGITIFVHEFGHFIVARKCGLVVETFSIGMGPALWKKEIGGITYKIGAFPIGGYVSLPQLDPEGMETMQGDNENDREKLPDISPWKKIAVAVAGPLFNIILGLILGIIIYFLPTKIADEAGVFIAKVDKESAAYSEGLRDGDQIKAVNGTPVNNWYEAKVEAMLKMKENHLTDLTVFSPDEGKRVLTIKVNDPKTEPDLIKGATPAQPCKIEKVQPNSPAERAGIKANDIILGINGTTITKVEDFIDIVKENEGNELPIKLLRDGKTITLQVTPEKMDSVPRIGIIFNQSIALPWTLDGNPIKQVTSDASSIFRFLKALTTPSEAKQAAEGAGGPVSIFKLLYHSIMMGAIFALGLTRFININLAIFNLLPIPVLDGGHICFSLWEGITRRKVPAKVVSILVQIFAVILILLMGLLTFRDVGGMRLFNRGEKEKTEQVEPAKEKEIPTEEIKDEGSAPEPEPTD